MNRIETGTRVIVVLFEMQRANADVTLRSLSRRSGIPLKALAQVLRRFAVRGLVRRDLSLTMRGLAVATALRAEFGDMSRRPLARIEQGLKPVKLVPFDRQVDAQEAA